MEKATLWIPGRQKRNCSPCKRVLLKHIAMPSSVFFKFKSQKEPTRVEFDGTGISVFELKRDIIIKSGLGDGTDFDLAIYSEDGKEGECSSSVILTVIRGC